MDDRKLFSQFYSVDTNKYEDKPRFRLRFLKYLEDFVNHNSPQNIYLKCRAQMGLDIEKIPLANARRRDEYLYAVEKLFAERSMFDILDFAGICYYTLEPYQADNHYLVDSLKNYLIEVNKIFREESMCYVMHYDGRIRYYPDEEFHQTIKSTLIILNKPKYQANLKVFNDVLDDFYKNHNKESPIYEFFKCLETFALSLISDKKYNRLNDSSIDRLMTIVTDHINSDSGYMEYDREAILNIRGIFAKWTLMAHKYRHGKADQVNNDVPSELFNYIFTTGISIFRFLLEIDDKYNIKS